MNRNELIILLYHGVTNEKSHGISNYSGKHIKLEEFEKHMRFISKNYNTLSINDIIEIDSSGASWPSNSVAVTFDDGFKNNFEYAAPVLEAFNIPSVFYICAGMVNTDLMFWVDKIEDCINSTNKKTIGLKLGEYIKFQLDTKKEKVLAIENIKKYCKRTSTDIKNTVIKELIDVTEVNPSIDHSDNYKMMNWEEVAYLDANNLFTIGGHTLFHDIMTSKPLEKLDLDVHLTLSLLEYQLGHKIEHFSYPEGQAMHYNNEIITTLKKHGVLCSPSAIDGVNRTGEDLFQLRRIMPGFMNRDFPLFSN